MHHRRTVVSKNGEQSTDLESILAEWFDPDTKEINVDGAAFGLAFEALWRVKFLLEDKGLDNADVGALLRQIGDTTLDLSYDFAKQADEGIEWV